jgi:hypothetical protein
LRRARLSEMTSTSLLVCATAADAVRSVVEQHFPKLWAAVDLGLSTAATLLLKDNANPTAVILVGSASAGKTTVASMFAGANVRRAPGKPPEPLCYRSDKFSAAAFVSQAANRTATQLDDVDLLPKIKERVLLTPELAPLFRSEETELSNAFAIITRVLDGQGLVTDSGTHGRRGYEDQHLFAWIGCTTPLPERVWRVMGQLGSRLFFLLLDTTQAVSVEELLSISEGVPYSKRLEESSTAVHTFLRDLFERHDGVRSVAWDLSRDATEARFWLARCATLLAAMRSVPTEERDEHNRRVYRPSAPEAPYRALAVLSNVARGHALVHGRDRVTAEDIPLIVRVTSSSMPRDSALLLRGLVEQGTLTVDQAKTILGTKHPETARDRMRYMHALGVAEFDEPGSTRAAHLQLMPEWKWCAEPDFQALLLGTCH